MAAGLKSFAPNLYEAQEFEADVLSVEFDEKSCDYRITLGGEYAAQRNIKVVLLGRCPDWIPRAGTRANIAVARKGLNGPWVAVCANPRF